MRGSKNERRVLKIQVGKWLKNAPRGSQQQAAKVLGLSTRTMRSWKRSCEESPVRVGRKPRAISFKEIKEVLREWERQGRPGSRPVSLALPQVSLRHVRLIVARLKKRKRKQYQKIRIANRTSVKIKVPGVFLVADGTTDKQKQDHLVVRDRASLKTEVSHCLSKHLQAQDTLKFLKKLKKEGRLPLVLGTDNGSPLCAGVVKDFIRENKIIHLRSLPRVSQHNASAENAVREFKEILDIGVEAINACEILNYARRRQKLGGLTSQQFEQKYIKKITQEDRALFYETACLAIEASKLGEKSSCQKRKDERQAIFQTLERFSLITITKGPLALPKKAEVIS
jgi:transposase InsO family protein